MGDILAVGHRFDGGAGEHGADGAALVEDYSHDPGKQFCRTSRTNEAPGHIIGKMQRSAVFVPHPDQAAEGPEVDQQDLGILAAAQAGDQVGIDDVVLGGDQPAHQYPDEQCQDDVAGVEADEQGYQRRKQGEKIVVFGRIPCRINLRNTVPERCPDH